MEFSPKDERFHFLRLDFSPLSTGGKVKVYADSGGGECSRCHGQDPRPLWPQYDRWQGVMGGVDDLVSQHVGGYYERDIKPKDRAVVEKDYEDYQKYLSARKVPGSRYAWLAHPEDFPLFPYGAHAKDGTGFHLKPNTRLGHAWSKLNVERVVALAQRLPDLPFVCDGMMYEQMCRPYPIDGVEKNKAFDHELSRMEKVFAARGISFEGAKRREHGEDAGFRDYFRLLGLSSSALQLAQRPGETAAPYFDYWDGIASAASQFSDACIRDHFARHHEPVPEEKGEGIDFSRRALEQGILDGYYKHSEEARHVYDTVMKHFEYRLGGLKFHLTHYPCSGVRADLDAELDRIERRGTPPAAKAPSPHAVTSRLGAADH
jgi:hypothetical protein